MNCCQTVNLINFMLSFVLGLDVKNQKAMKSRIFCHICVHDLKGINYNPD